MLQKFEEYKQQIDQIVSDKNKPWSGIFDQIEAKTGLPRSYIFLGKLIALFQDINFQKFYSRKE